MKEKSIPVFLWFIIAYFSFVQCATDTTLDCQKYIGPTTCTLNSVTSINITQSNPCSFYCESIWTKNFTSSRRLFIKQHWLVNSRSVFATIQSENFIKVYKLPITFEDTGNLYTSLSEVICPSRGKIFVSITTNSEDNVLIDFYLRPVPFALPDTGISVKASPVSPWSKYYEWQDGLNSIFISVTSKTPDDAKICAILHIQEAKCPVATSLQEIQGGNGKYQSFRQFGGTVVNRYDFPDGLFVVILPLPNDDMCLTQSPGDHILSKRSKTVVIQAINISSAKSSWIAYVASFGIFSTFIGTWLYVLRMRSFRHFNSLLANHGRLDHADSNLREPQAFIHIYQVLRLLANRNQRNNPDENMECAPEPGPGERSESDESLIVATSMPDCELPLRDMMPSSSIPLSIPISNQLNPRVVSWWKSESVYEEMKPSSKMSEIAFSRNILIVAAFSTIPVYSVLRFLGKISDHRLDTCYFNRRCMFSVGYIQDFSRVFTNFTYIVVALALKYFMNYHEKLTMAASKLVGRIDIGVCRHYNLFSVLAYELIMQAIMSSLFHLCPNYVTIKFDLIFIFAIAVTYIGCIWSLRHSDCNQFTYSTFGLIGSTLFIAELKELIPHWLFWVVVAIAQGYLVLSISFLLTKFGTFSFNPTNMVLLYKKWTSIIGEVKQLDSYERSTLFPTFVRIAIGIVANAVMFIVGVYFDYDFYSYVFSVCMVNVVCYSTHYIFTKKVLKNESGTWHGWASIALAFIAAVISMVFFNISRTDYNATAAESLMYNSSCLVSVFSYHDMWHFTSAITTFALFTGMLILDDDLAIKSSSEVPVF